MTLSSRERCQTHTHNVRGKRRLPFGRLAQDSGPPCVRVGRVRRWESQMSDTGSRAVRFDRYGGRDVLYVADVSMPIAGEGEVVVAVKAAGINPGETAIRSGALRERFPATFPSGEGSDLAGLVTAVGEGVNEFVVGDAVLGFSWQRSSHATHVAVPTSQLIRKPRELSWEVAGSLYVVGCTAYAAVRAVAARRGRPLRSQRRPVVSGPSWCSSWACGEHMSLALPRRRTPNGSDPTAPCPSSMATD